MYPFIEAEKAEQGKVVRTCAVLQVSRSAYYEWAQGEPSRRRQEDAELGQRVSRIST